MQVLKDTWNGFMARRRLDQLWLEMQAKFQAGQQPDLRQFFQSFLQMMQQEPPIEQIFGHRDSLLELVLRLLTTDQDWQTLLHALLHIVKDLLNSHNGDDNSACFVQICEVLAKTTTVSQEAARVRNSLKLIKFLFCKVQDLKQKMAEKGLFVWLLLCLGAKDEQSQSLILNFFKMELVVTNNDEESEQRWSLLSDPGDNRTGLTSLIQRVKTTLLKDIPTEYREQLNPSLDQNPFIQAQHRSEATPFSVASDSQPLSRDQIESLARDSKPTEDEQTLQHTMKQNGFKHALQQQISECDESQLQVYVMCAYILNQFTESNWAESEKSGLLLQVQKRFLGSDRQVELFKEMFVVMVTGGKTDLRIRNIRLWRFILMLVGQSQQQDLLFCELGNLMHANQANPVIFMNEQGFKWLTEQKFTQNLVDLTNFLLHILSHSQQETQDFLLEISTRNCPFIYSLLKDYFKANPKNISDQLFSNALQLYMNDGESARQLMDQLAQYQLQVDDCRFRLSPLMSRISDLLSGDLQDVYLACQIIKCAQRCAEPFDLEGSYQVVRPELQTQVLRMLFVPSNNSKAFELKTSQHEMFEQEYRKMKDAFQRKDHQAAQALLNLTILSSGCSQTKQKLDFQLQQDFTSIIQSFKNVSDYPQPIQKQIAQCLVELQTDQTGPDCTIVYDYATGEELLGFSKIVKPEGRVFLRPEADQKFLMLAAVSLGVESLVLILEKLSQLSCCYENRRTMVQNGFQSFLIALLEHSNAQQRNSQLRSITLQLLNQLLEEAVFQVIPQKLLQPALIPSLTRILGQNQQPANYGYCEREAAKFLIKINGTVKEFNQLFKKPLIGLQRTAQGYFLRMETQTYDLTKQVELGLYELEGWNQFEITGARLLINSINVCELDSPSLLPSSSVVCEIPITDDQLETFEQQFVQFDSISGQSYSIVKATVIVNGVQSTNDIQTLKQLLSTDATLHSITEMLDQARGDDHFISVMRLLVALVTKNPADLVNDFQLPLLKRKLIEMHPKGVQKIMTLLVDISLDQVDGCQRLQEQDESLRPSLKKPSLLKMPFELIGQVAYEQGAKFIDNLQVLLQSEANLRLFYDQFGVEPVITILELIRGNARKVGLYENTIKVFELFIDGARAKILAPCVLQTVFEYILSIASDDNKMTSKIAIDCLSVCMIHLVIDDTDALLKIMLDQHITQNIYKLLQSTVIEIREYAFKMVCFLVAKSEQVRAEIRFETISDIFLMQGQSMNLCMVVLDSALGRFVNVSDLTPENDSLVIQMMNQSKSAQKIVQQLTHSFSQTKRQSICNLGMIECFMAALARLTNDVSRHMCLKQFTVILIDNNNIELFYRDDLLARLMLQLFTFQLRVTEVEDNTARQFYDSYLWDRSQSYPRGGYSTTEDDQLHTSAARSESSRQSNEVMPPTRTIDAVLDLITQIVVRDLQLPFFESQIYNVMLVQPYLDERLQQQILQRILRYFHKQPKVDDKQVLLNLYRIFQNLEKLIAESEFVMLRVVNLINLIAFKSTTDVRKMMKENKLLELRDQLMVKLVRVTYQVKTEFMYAQLGQFSFECIASKQLFTQNCCSEYLVLIAAEARDQEFNQKIVQEVLQFEQNSLRVPDISDPEVVKRCRVRVEEHLQEQLQIRAEFTREREGRRLILNQEHQQQLRERASQTKQALI